MRTSYLLLDEYMRFLDCSGGSKTPSKSILEVGVEEALKASGFNEDLFHQRGGVYDWSRESAAPPSACGSPSSNVGDIEDLVAGQ
jgi:radical S-adenosyl methionine domain-containing protein 2